MAKTSLRAYNREIETMLDRGQVDEVVAHCLHILKSHPKYLETYRLLGKAYLEMKKYGDAVDIFSRVLVCAPSDFVSHVGMGIIRDEENKLDDAIWHMERAFETQPSNAAVQSELQRLYGRRDGSAPPRIRMTRGALAQMYVKGELYPQAISEIKNVLGEDPGRSDMSALLAKAYYKSGQKTDAAEVASSLLRRYPYCYDANAVLVEIFSADKPENVQVYRQRVVELDPYAAHVSGSIFDTTKAPESAISIEKLDWSGQPVGMPADWRESRGISLEAKDEPEPAWLRKGFETETQVPPQLASTPASPSDDNIPDFLREAGWGQSTGAFDESKASMFENEETLPPTAAAPLVAGEMPDWVRELKPSEKNVPAEPAESMPDWMNRIDPGILPEKESALPGDTPDWMKDLAQPDSAAQPASAFREEPDWLTSLGGADANKPMESAASSDQPDWLKSFGAEETPAQPTAAGDQPDWLTSLGGEPASPVAAQSADEFDFLDAPAEQPKATQSPSVTASLDTAGLTPQAEDDAFAWLESLAVKQGSTEGLLIKPEERSTEEPDWVKQAKSLTEEPRAEAIAPTMGMPEAMATEPEPAATVEETGKAAPTEDDAFAWLESLAVKQGSTEGLLMKPEERSSEEPEWVRQAKERGEPAPVESPVAQEPQSPVDTAMWLKSLDEEGPAKTPVTVGKADETAMWLKSLDEPEPKAEPVSGAADGDVSGWLQALEDSETTPAPLEPASSDELPAWLGASASGAETSAPAEEPQAVSVEAPRLNTGPLPSWLSGVDDEEKPPMTGELPAWLRDDMGEVVAEPTRIEPTRADEWQPVESTEAPVAFEAPIEKPKPARKADAARKSEPRPATPVSTYQEPVTRKGTGMLTSPVELTLGNARNELSRSNIPGALETYSKLIKKGKYLDEVIFDLREALYRYPVEVSIWQSLGDAYMRANRLQDALDSYTKAEELLR
jgi:tetratricopeptide (TPR) repeat protein